jgi:hypothetical protein
MTRTIDPQCTECYGRGWVNAIVEQDEEWYNENPDRSRPSYYAASTPCPDCNPQPVSRLRELGGSILSRPLER